MSDKAVYRTAPATPGLLKIVMVKQMDFEGDEDRLGSSYTPTSIRLFLYT